MKTIDELSPRADGTRGRTVVGTSNKGGSYLRLRARSRTTIWESPARHVVRLNPESTCESSNPIKSMGPSAD